MSKEIIKIEKEIEPIVKCRATRTSLEIPPDTTIDEWLKIGVALKNLYRANKWWIGDWINFGASKAEYGEMYTQALDETDYRYETLRNYKWVASQVEMSRRRDNLSFSHHFEVAKFKPEEQTIWLEKADKHKWTDDRFRLEIKKYEIKKRQQILLKRARGLEESDLINIQQGDFRKLSKDIEKDSLDLILTDPPYPKEYLNLWQDLFEVAERILKPSAFLVAYSGQMHLDEIFRMKNNLLYYWIMSIEFTKKPLILGRNVINEWKPILIFQKPPFKKLEKTLGDKIRFDYTERELHDDNWGQTIEPFEFLLEAFSEINDFVLDPFAGTGTTLLACRNKNRRCIGMEIEKKYINIIKGRLNDR
jgi:DNA modification methylase